MKLDGDTNREFPGFCAGHGCSGPRLPGLTPLPGGGALVEDLPPADSDPLAVPVGLLVVGSQTGIASIVQDIVRNAPAEFYSCGYVPDAGTAQRVLDVAKPKIVLIELALPDRCGLRVAAELLV